MKRQIVGTVVLMDIAGDDGSITSRLVLHSRVFQWVGRVLP